MLNVSSDSESSKKIIDSLVVPWHSQKTIGIKVSELLKDRLAVISTVDLAKVLDQIRDNNIELYQALTRYVDSGLLRDIHGNCDLIPVSGVRNSLNSTLSKVFSHSANIYTSAVDSETIKKYEMHLDTKIYHPDLPYKLIEREFIKEELELIEGQKSDWKTILKNYRHTSTSITIVDQYLFSGKSDVAKFINGLIVRSLKPTTIRLITRRSDNGGTASQCIISLQESMPGCKIEVYTFGSIASKKIHDREVLTDSLHLFMGSGLDTISDGVVRINSLITITGRYYEGGRQFQSRKNRLDQLCKDSGSKKETFMPE
jgi:hypothetical protein